MALHVDETLTARRALRLIRSGRTLLWQGDFQQAKQLLAAVGRRLPIPADTGFTEYRRHQARRAVLLNRLHVPVDPDWSVPLRRAPDVRAACRAAYEVAPGSIPLRELLGVIGAYQLRLRGVLVPAIGGRIHPHFGVFPPTRSDYLELVGRQPLGRVETAFDIGTGTGVLAAILARRGVPVVVGTDNNPRAVTCARDNLDRLGLPVQVLQTDLFPPGRADLVVCNPPWLPAEPAGSLDHAVYDPGGRMLSGFLTGLADHLTPTGEAWLILSDLAERLGLRAPGEVTAAISAAGLVVTGRSTTRPVHRRARDLSDPLARARQAEEISLWRLVHTVGGARRGAGPVPRRPHRLPGGPGTVRSGAPPGSHALTWGQGRSGRM